MANRERGEMTLAVDQPTYVDGQLVVDDAGLPVVTRVSYTLRLTINACCDLEDRSGHAWHEWLTEWKARRHTRPLRWLLWASLQDRHAAQFPTVTEVGRLMDDAVKEDLEKVMAAFVWLNEEIRESLEQQGLLPRAPEKKRPTAADPRPAGSGSTSKLARSA